MVDKDTITRDDVLSLAELYHELARIVWFYTTGNFSHLPWHMTPQKEKERIVSLIWYIIDNKEATPESIHNYWRDCNVKAGWTHGLFIDYEKKRHPYLLDFGLLPLEVRAQGAIIVTVVRQGIALLKKKKVENV